MPAASTRWTALLERLHDMPEKSATIIGSPVSPYVRKVLAACELKGIAYELDPIVAFFGSDEFSELSPVRRVPVYIDDQVSISDSTVICEYLEERFPTPHLLPSDPAQRARARWLEEFADTRMADVFLWRVFNEAVINPFIWQRPREKEKIARAVAEDVPPVVDYLERQAPSEGFLFDELSIADIAVAVSFSNLRWARVELDQTRWPKTSAWVARTNATPGLAKLNDLGAKLMRVPPDQQRKALAELGVRVTVSTLATGAPRRGPMTVA
jgi:glutathione S-transferase